MSSSLTFYSLGASIISLGLISASTIFFGLPLFRTDTEIRDLTSTFVGGNPYMRDALMRDRRNAFYGLFLLSLGILFQFLSITIQMLL